MTAAADTTSTYGATQSSSSMPCLYTKHKTQRHKRWHDGRWGGGTLYDEHDRVLDRVEGPARSSSSIFESEHYLIQLVNEEEEAAPPTELSARMRSVVSKKFQRPPRRIPPERRDLAVVHTRGMEARGMESLPQHGRRNVEAEPSLPSFRGVVEEDPPVTEDPSTRDAPRPAKMFRRLELIQNRAGPQYDDEEEEEEDEEDTLEETVAPNVSPQPFSTFHVERVEQTTSTTQLLNLFQWNDPEKDEVPQPEEEKDEEAFVLPNDDASTDEEEASTDAA